MGGGIFHSLSIVLPELGITEVDVEHCSKLLGIGSDGAACNIATGGLKVQVKAMLSWVICT